MTDRVHALIVTLTNDEREDDVAGLIAAIQLMRGVAGVQPRVSDGMTAIAFARARREIGERVIAALYNDKQEHS